LKFINFFFVKRLTLKKAKNFQNFFEKFAFYGLDLELEPELESEPEPNFSKVGTGPEPEPEP
jgi:hypothetical protein